MVIVFSLLGYENVRLHRKDLEEMTLAAGDRIGETIKRSTRYGMLNNHSAEVHEIIKTIGAQPGINKIRIFNEDGEIKLSTDESETATSVDKRAEACYTCHEPDKPLAQLSPPYHAEFSSLARTRIYTVADERVLGVINPIENEPSCSNSGCHAHSPDKKILGVVDVTLSLAKVDEAIAEGREQMITTFVAAIVAISLMVAGLIWVMVARPGKELIVGMKRVAAGDLDYKIEVASKDEIGELANSFNRMTSRLAEANTEISAWAKNLESRVEQKTAELRQAHEHIVRVERMASIGKLAAIVAHEVNNPLAGILIYARLLLKKMTNSKRDEPDAEEYRKHLEVIASESARCGDIIKNLLQFARKTQADLAPNDINELIRQSVRLVQHKIDLMGITTRIELDETVKDVVCDAQQVKQALVALLINSCEAMRQEEGILEICSRHLSQQRMVEIRIADNGVGMDEETRRHAFEPFFTTKEQGKGVGLGLAVVYGIVAAHGGEIDLESSPGVGTTVTIRLQERAQRPLGEAPSLWHEEAVPATAAENTHASNREQRS
jgi:two-component system NtrC family sensor kinase